jgi:retinol dehydrogenase-12
LSLSPPMYFRPGGLPGPPLPQYPLRSPEYPEDVQNGSHREVGVEDTEKPLAGRTCLVTGATSGIGEVTARELARKGATVVIVGRDRARCKATVATIRKQASNPAVEYVLADLSSQSEIRRAAAEFLARHSRLHVLVNNAGALLARRCESVDGIEMTLALNHLAPFLLTNLLLDTLKASAAARVVTVSSHVHEMVRGFDFDDPQAARRGFWGYGGRAGPLLTFVAPMKHPALLQYARSKLANLLFTYELARRLEGTGVTANALHPGFVATRFTAGNGVLGWCMRRWAAVCSASARERGRKRCSTWRHRPRWKAFQASTLPAAARRRLPRRRRTRRRRGGCGS